MVANDLFPISLEEIILGSILAIIGTLVIGIRFGEFTALMQAMDKRDNEANEEFDLVTQVMRNLNITEPM